MKAFSGISLVATFLFISGVAQADRAEMASGARRAPRVYEQSKRLAESRLTETQTQNEIQSSEDRTITDINTLPGLLPWEALTFKNRVRRAMNKMDISELPYMKPEVKAKKHVIHYDRLNRSARGTLNGERTGKNKLWKLYYQ